MKIRVKHLIKYLEKFSPDTVIYLDKDGWLADFIEHKDEVDLIDKRGLFDEHEDHITLNN